MNDPVRRSALFVAIAGFVFVSVTFAQGLAAPGLKTDGTLPGTGIRYLVERSGPGLTFFTQIAGPISEARYLIETGRSEAGARYTYRVRAIDAASNLGPYSNAVSVLAPSRGLPLVGNDPVALLTTLPNYRGNPLPSPSTEPAPDQRFVSPDSTSLMLSLVAPVVVQGQPKELAEINDRDYPACVKAYEERIKQSTRDASLHYRTGICLFYQVRSINEAAVAANMAHRRFIEGCNRNLSCDSAENRARIAELATREEEIRKDFERLTDKAIDAFATAVAIGGDGPEIAAARTELEKLYRTKGIPGNNPLDAVDRLIAEKKRDLQQ